MTAYWWDQVETDHNNEIAREVAMQKQLASSFKLAVCARAFWCVLSRVHLSWIVTDASCYTQANHCERHFEED